MKRISLLATACMATLMAAAQFADITPVLASPVDEGTNIGAARMVSATPLYSLPQGLRNIGAIHVEEPPYPAASYPTRHRMNGKAALWAPKDARIRYSATVFGDWTVPGALEATASGQEIIVTYDTPGLYNFPTIVTADGTEYTAPGQIKIGDIVEISAADTREWLTTYALGEMPFDTDGGWLGGTNNRGILGVGNLYMHSLEEGYMDGVNVYMPAKPTRYAPDAKIRVRVWMPSITEYGVSLAYIPLEGDYISFDDFKTSEDGEWVPVTSGAVAQLRFPTPLDLFGKQLIFIDVDGWGTDKSTEDFRLLMDVQPNISMEIEDWSNMISHNSYVRFQGENDYLRPVMQFGGQFASFMICPILRGSEAVGVNGVTTENGTLNVIRQGNTVSVAAPGANSITLYNTAGIALRTLNADCYSFDASTLATGIYMLRADDGSVVKIRI